MKIDPNAPSYPCTQHFGDYGIPPATWTGIPIRLAIAAQIMAGFAAWSGNSRHDLIPPELAQQSALEWADALIAAHNEGRP